MPWMNFAWLRRWVPLLLPVAEAAWLIPWMLVVSGAMFPRGELILAPLPLTAMIVGGYLLAGTTEARAPLSRARIGVVLLAIVLGLWAVWTTHYQRAAPLWHPRWIWTLLQDAHDAIPDIPAAVIGALAAPLLLWRGVALGAREFSHFVAEQSFRRGMVWSAFFAFFFAVFQNSPVFVHARPVAAGYILGFFFLSLVLLTVARLLGLWEEVRGKDPRALAFNRPWFAVAMAVTATIVLVGGVLGQFAGLNVWPRLRPVLRLLAPVLEAVFLVLFYAASLVARALLFVLSRIPEAYRPRPLEPIPNALRSLRDLQLSPEVVSGARWGIVVLGVLILAFIFLVIVVRGRRRLATADEDERESVWERDSLRRVLRRWLRPGSRRRAAGDLDGAPEVIAIRLLYRRLLQAAAAVGQGRRREQTAREFQEGMRPAVPEAERDLGGLTVTYEEVRYGAHRPTGREVEVARGQLARVVQALESRGHE